MTSNLSGSLTNAAQDLIEARLQSGALVRFHVFTTSMLPTLCPGDALLVQRAFAAEVAPGDLLVIRHGSAWMVHRLLQLPAMGGGFYLLTKGDNRLFADPVFESSQLIGAVKSIQRGNRTIHLFTWQARLGGRALAGLSWTQGKLYKPAPGLLRKILLQVLRRGIYILARLVYNP